MPDPNKFAVLILQGVTEYGSLNAFDQEVARIIRKMSDLDVVMFDLDDTATFNARLQAVLNQYPKRIAAAFSFSGFGIELVDGNKKNAWQTLGIPVLTCLLDHPGYFLSRHKTESPAIMRMYPNRDFLEFNRTYLKAPYRMAFCGWGAMSFGRQPRRREPKPGQEQAIIFPKSGGNPAEYEAKWKQLPVVMQRVIYDARDHYWGETPRSGPVVNSVLAAADAVGLELRSDLPLFSFFIAHLDIYIRRLKTDVMMRALMPLPVKIFGKGLDYFDTSNARAQILPPVPFEKLTDMMFDIFGIISMNPNIDHECHDRPYMALGSGALPISDINPWWAENYPDLLPYSYDFRDRTLTAAVETALADPVKAAEVAWRESERQIKKRTFEDTVADMLALTTMHSYFSLHFQSLLGSYIKCGD